MFNSAACGRSHDARRIDGQYREEASASCLLLFLKKRGTINNGRNILALCLGACA